MACSTRCVDGCDHNPPSKDVRPRTCSCSLVHTHAHTHTHTHTHARARARAKQFTRTLTSFTRNRPNRTDPQTSFIYSCWDLPPLDTPPSSIFRVDTATPPPRVGEPLLQCHGSQELGLVHLGEATGNSTDLFFLVDWDKQVSCLLPSTTRSFFRSKNRLRSKTMFTAQ
jgi:hypothetical protein